MHENKSLVGLAREVARDAPGLQERLCANQLVIWVQIILR